MVKMLLKIDNQVRVCEGISDADILQAVLDGKYENCPKPKQVEILKKYAFTPPDTNQAQILNLKNSAKMLKQYNRNKNNCSGL